APTGSPNAFITSPSPSWSVAVIPNVSNSSSRTSCGPGFVITGALFKLPTNHWHDAIGEATLADAILDRLLHNAHKIQLEGESMRKIHAEKNKREHFTLN
ncbi:MAG: hypothetical protein ACI9FD_003802, partial [Gammaproteobacteria bacterium]